jgi:hypothetical protein
MLVEYRRVRSKKFDFSLAYEAESAAAAGEVPVRIYLKQNSTGEAYLNYDDIIMVQYELDPSFKSRTIASRDGGNRFEVRIWAHSSFELTATVLLKAGRTEIIRGNVDPRKGGN